jgi:hypothetical protein
MTDITTLLPTTELEAVNAMLDSIGEAPIDSLIDIEAPDAGTALRRLRIVSKAVQLIGWEWNTDEDVVITPDSNGFLVLPANTLKVIATSSDSRVKLTQRGNKLYDRTNQTDVFTSSVKATLITALLFEDLPEAARQYIMLTAAEKFQEGAVGSAQLDKFAEQARMAALQSLEAAESEVGRYNILTDNWDSARLFYGRTGNF